jgi:hypothetical protein
VVPLFTTARHGFVPSVEEVRDLVGYVQRHREGRHGTPFEVVIGGGSPGKPAAARDLIAPLADAGATWWDERKPQTGDDFYRLEPVLRRVEQGPPTLSVG